MTLRGSAPVPTPECAAGADAGDEEVDVAAGTSRFAGSRVVRRESRGWLFS